MGAQHQHEDRAVNVTEDSVQIARLDERLRQLDTELKALTHGLEELQVQMGQILDKLNEAKGGWRMLMWLGGGAASLGAGISWALTHVTVK